MQAISGSAVMKSWLNRASVLADAAEAVATVSGMSLGDWQAPVRKIPRVTLSTGASLVCASVNR